MTAGGALPLVDAPLLAAAARRTRLERAALVAALALALLVAVLATRHPDLQGAPLVPQGSDGIVVLDLSASISPDTYARIGATLDRLAAGGGRAGLVIFSDVAYEALPPGTPAEQLRPLVRYFTLPKARQPGFLPQLPKNPWADTFSGGTRISTGIELARDVARRDRLRRPTLVLVSDLDDDPTDLARLRPLLTDLDASGVRLRVVSLNASPEDARFFRRVVARDDIVRARLPQAAAQPSRRAALPAALAVAVLAAAALLAAHALLFNRLVWRAQA
jgi:hypothetical protein